MNHAFSARLRNVAPRISIAPRITAAAASFAIVTLAFASGAGETPPIPPAGAPACQGYGLFMLNCAHCHGADARGDEGPDLHGVTKSDARIAAMIKNGVKGEMPKFGAKLSDAQVRELIAFVRSLQD